MVGRALKNKYEGNYQIKREWITVIRFKSEDAPQILVIPTSEDIDYLFTAQGFTSGNNGRLGIPEWNLLQRIDFEDGAELWEVFNDGRETLRAVYKDGKFNTIK